MKRLIALLGILSLLLSLAACRIDDAGPAADPDDSSAEKPGDSPAGDPTTPTEDEPVSQKPDFTADTLPRLDGSTATIPLSEALVQSLLDYTPEQAQEFVNHATTHAAYENLINGDCDIIFVTPPSAEELQLMDDSGQQFEVVPVVKDAFVFLTGVDNPVESLTVEQLKGIYTGQITNWNEVGGPDAAITAYQRPDNSGSQTLMYKLLVPADEIMEAPHELIIADMGGLIDAVSDYQAGPTSLGYSVFYYANGMYTSEGSHMLAVDGVAPTVETIASGEYPLTDAYYAVFRTGDDENPAVRELIDWILTDEGQKLMQSAGYVPLRILE